RGARTDRLESPANLNVVLAPNVRKVVAENGNGDNSALHLLAGKRIGNRFECEVVRPRRIEQCREVELRARFPIKELVYLAVANRPSVPDHVSVAVIYYLSRERIASKLDRRQEILLVTITVSQNAEATEEFHFVG